MPSCSPSCAKNVVMSRHTLFLFSFLVTSQLFTCQDPQLPYEGNPGHSLLHSSRLWSPGCHNLSFSFFLFLSRPLSSSPPSLPLTTVLDVTSFSTFPTHCTCSLEFHTARNLELSCQQIGFHRSSQLGLCFLDSLAAAQYSNSLSVATSLCQLHGSRCRF